jgi:hypothetical protein
MFKFLRQLTQSESRELTTELKQFDVTEEAIATMANEFMALQVDGLEDREGLAKVHTARMTVRDKRCRVEDRRKELVADALKHQRNVNTVAKHITSQLLPIEDHLQAQEDAIAELKEAKRAEQMRKEEERIEREKKEAVERALEEERQRQAEKDQAQAREAERLEAARLKAEEDRKDWEDKIRKEAAALKEQRRQLEEEKAKIQPAPAPPAGPPPGSRVIVLNPARCPNGHWKGATINGTTCPTCGAELISGGTISEVPTVEIPEPAPINVMEGRGGVITGRVATIEETRRILGDATLFPVDAQPSEDESARARILHRCELIVDNTTDMEPIADESTRVLWDEFTRIICGAVAAVRADLKRIEQPKP